MKTSDSELHGGRCPECGEKTRRDRIGRGFVAHKHAGCVRDEAGDYLRDGAGRLVPCLHGLKERDRR